MSSTPKSKALDVVSDIIGWMYFFAWSISFYPQMWTNFIRKSVVGLNFDFIALNLMGFFLYTLFNVGLYFIAQIQAQYKQRFIGGQIPVFLNDVFFAVHALLVTMFTIYQCLIYEREDQRVSTVCRAILSLYGVIFATSMGLAAAGVILWLDFLYICSSAKISITLFKYVPQAYMNYKRKSTEGWSIGNILLDFTGGVLSVLQMIVNAYNYDNWSSLIGDFTKFFLGLFSLSFDIFFMLQHYVFYREEGEEVDEDD